MGHDTLVGKTTYTSLPYLISLPMWGDETQSWTYDLLTSPKPNKTTSGSSQDADKDKTSNGTGNTTGTTGGASTVWQKHAQTGEELSYWLSYAIIGLALIKVGKAPCWANDGRVATVTARVEDSVRNRSILRHSPDECRL